MDEQRPEADTPPRPWVAATLTLLVPGLGHLYARRPLIFPVAVVATPLVGVAALSGMFLLPGILSPLVVPLALGVLAAFAVHAWRTARRASAEGRLSRWIRWPLILALLLVASYGQTAFLDAVRTRWARTFVLTSASMEPTLQEGDYVLADRRSGDAVRGDIITYLSPDEPIELVGRVVAVGGDVVGMVDGVLYLNSAPVVEPFAYYSDSMDAVFPGMRWQVDHLLAPDSAGGGRYEPTARTWGLILVPEGTVFVLGDHRNESFDSRHRGPTPVHDVTGHPRRVYFSRSPSGGLRWSRLGAWVR